MLNIYTAQVPLLYEEKEVYPKERQEMIKSTKNEAVRRERYFVWKLLEYAVKDSLDKSLEEIEPYMSESGKWLSDKCFFSLSHSDGAAAVAISDAPVGVDIEAKREIDALLFSKRILTESERATLQDSENVNDCVLLMWCKKESIYKMIGKPPFAPSKMETEDYPLVTRTEMIWDKEYFVSACSDKKGDAHFFNITL